jgi:hypothetical protein
MEPQVLRDEHGQEFRLPVAFMGAEGRYEDWVYLGMIEREWKRTVKEEDRFLGTLPALWLSMLSIPRHFHGLLFAALGLKVSSRSHVLRRTRWSAPR